MYAVFFQVTKPSSPESKSSESKGVCSVTDKSKELKRTHPLRPLEDMTNKKVRNGLEEKLW